MKKKPCGSTSKSNWKSAILGMLGGPFITWQVKAMFNCVVNPDSQVLGCFFDGLGVSKVLGYLGLV